VVSGRSDGIRLQAAGGLQAASPSLMHGDLFARGELLAAVAALMRGGLLATQGRGTRASTRSCNWRPPFGTRAMHCGTLSSTGTRWCTVRAQAPPIPAPPARSAPRRHGARPVAARAGQVARRSDAGARPWSGTGRCPSPHAARPHSGGPQAMGSGSL
jgi:hypothetical protein